jgi:hypothetical protein
MFVTTGTSPIKAKSTSYPVATTIICAGATINTATTTTNSNNKTNQKMDRLINTEVDK